MSSRQSPGAFRARRRRQQRGGDDEENCTTAALVPRAFVSEAELNDAGTVFTEVELGQTGDPG